jgi:hypothetical protein
MQNLQAGVFQRWLIFLLLLALAVVTLFPPWTYTYSKAGMSPVLRPAPRGFLFTPPEPLVRGSIYHGIILDLRRLFAEWVALLLSGCAIYVFATFSGGLFRGPSFRERKSHSEGRSVSFWAIRLWLPLSAVGILCGFAGGVAGGPMGDTVEKGAIVLVIVGVGLGLVAAGERVRSFRRWLGLSLILLGWVLVALQIVSLVAQAMGWSAGLSRSSMRPIHDASPVSSVDSGWRKRFKVP